MRQAAAIARDGAGAIGAAQRRVIYRIQDAHHAGFAVDEDLSVTDTRISRSTALLSARKVQAQAFAGDIRQHATQFIGLEHEVASKITTATAGMASTAFRETPHSHKSQIQAVYRTWKRDPALPTPDNPKDMTAAQARAAWEAVNADIAQFNARCGRTFLLPNEQAAYETCVADRGPLLERQAAIRNRLAELDVPVGDDEPTPPTTGEPPVPQNVLDTMNQIDAGKWPGAANAPGTKGGSNFDNDNQTLPTRDASGNPITYKEWDVNPRLPNHDRDTERIVTGSDGSAWYTTDHYRTFHRIR
nr:ribonuclease domain-containing protein [Mycobacterium angelicum]